MRKNKEVLSIREKYSKFYPKQTKYSWLYILTGRSDDIFKFFTMILLDPIALYVGIVYVTGRLVNIIALYVVMDIIIVSWWAVKAVKRKQRMEDMKNDTKNDIEDRREIILKKIEELDNMVEREVITDKKILRQRRKEQREIMERAHIRMQYSTFLRTDVD